MTLGVPRSALGAIACAGILAWTVFSRTPLVDASVGSFPDLDCDLLPDDVEWALLTDPTMRDSDRDGIDDFVAAVTHRHHDLFDQAYEPPPVRASTLSPGPVPDHAARVVASIRPDPDGTPSVWLHFLFRFIGASTPEIQSFQAWLNQGPLYWPLEGMLGATGSGMASRTHNGETHVVFSSRVCREVDLLPFAPVIFGATVVVEGRALTSGVWLSAHSGKLAAFTPTSADSGVLVALDPAVVQDPFWSVDRVCYLTLSVLAGTGNGSLCEVVRAQCRRSDRLRCPPTCPSTVGQVVFVPDGIATLTGG